MDYELLKQLIKNSKFTIAELCEQLNINKSSFYYLISSDKFKVKDLLLIAIILNLSNEQILLLLNRG